MTTEINKKIGNRIKYLRQQRGLSQEKLAEAIDIATTSLSYVETGRGFMTLVTLEKLAKVLNVDFVAEDNLLTSYMLGSVDLLNEDTETEMIAEESGTVDFVAEDNLLTSYMLGSVDLLNEDTETEMIAEESNTVDFVAEESLLANYMYGSVNSEDLAEIEDDFLAMN